MGARMFASTSGALAPARRAARYDGLAAHLIGYVQPVGENGAYVGVSGLEQQYDGLLGNRVQRLPNDRSHRVDGRAHRQVDDAVRVRGSLRFRTFQRIPGEIRQRPGDGNSTQSGLPSPHPWEAAP